MVVILNEDDRVFQAWGSVEVRDNQGQMIPMTEFEPVMPILMKRGGFIIDSHSDRVVGRILNYEFKNKPIDGKDVPGLLLTNQIFKDYQTDDEVWAEIKNGESAGMSFGGITRKKEYKIVDGEPTEILKDLEAHEFTVTRSWEQPVNPEAEHVAINAIAKAQPSAREWTWRCRVMNNCDAELSVLKSYDPAKTVIKGEKYERCLQGIMNDPEFKPKDGKTKAESAHAICTQTVGKCGIATFKSVGFFKKIMKGQTVIMKGSEIAEITQEIKEGFIVKSKRDGKHYFINKSDASVIMKARTWVKDNRVKGGGYWRNTSGPGAQPEAGKQRTAGPGADVAPDWSDYQGGSLELRDDEGVHLNGQLLTGMFKIKDYDEKNNVFLLTDEDGKTIKMDPDVVYTLGEKPKETKPKNYNPAAEGARSAGKENQPASDPKQVQYYTDKFNQKMRGSSWETARGWVEGAGLSDADKMRVLQNIRTQHYPKENLAGDAGFRGEGKLKGLDPSIKDDIETDLGIKFGLKGVRIKDVKEYGDKKALSVTSEDGDMQVILNKDGTLEGPEGRLLTDHQNRLFYYKK